MKTFEVVYGLKGELLTKHVAGQFQTLTHAKGFAKTFSFPEGTDRYMITSNRGVEYDTRQSGFLK